MFLRTDIPKKEITAVLVLYILANIISAVGSAWIIKEVLR
jgi:hypothetical protein